jgi:starch synthase
MSFQFALLNAPDSYSADKQLMGRQAAGTGFLRAALNARPDRIWCYARSRADAGQFGALARTLGPYPPELRFIDWLHPEGLKTAGVLYRPDPDIGENAWHRQAAGQARGYSLCGITHSLSSYAVYSAVTQLLRAPLYPWDTLICTSTVAKTVIRHLFDAEAEHLRARFGATRVPEPHLVTIPLGVHCSDFVFTADQRAASRARIGIAADEIVVLFAGRLVFHAKAHPMPMFLGLERAAQRTGKRIRLLLFGQYPNAAIAKAFADEARRFAPSVTFTPLDGAVPENRDRAWSAADIFTSFSDNVQETFGLTPVEAMAAGLPVVVSDWNGYKDTVRDGIDGFRIPTWAMPAGTGADLADRYDMRIDNYDMHVGGLAQFVSVDVVSAAEAFVKLVSSPDLRRKMGEAGRQRAIAVFDWTVVFKRYLALWDEMAALRQSSPIQPGEDLTTRRPDRPDPSSLFASFSTCQPKDATRIALDQGGSTAHLNDLRALASTNFATAVLPPAATMAAVLDTFRSKRESNLSDLIMALPDQTRPVIVRSVLWLAKMSCLILTSSE